MVLQIRQVHELGSKYTWVQIFENRGAMMGSSNPHPHCQVWASNYLPNELKTKDTNQLNYYRKYGRQMLMDYVQRELLKRERVVIDSDEWVVVVPFWGFWPFETMLLPKKQVERMTDLNDKQRDDLAKVLKVLVIKYDNIFKCNFPYSMGWHGALTGKFLSECQNHWTLHAVYCPPLLRSASVKKFMVGYELFAQCQRDLTPEKAAKILRDQPEVLYKTI